MNLLESIGPQDIERLVQLRAKPDADLLTAIEDVDEQLRRISAHR